MKKKTKFPKDWILVDQEDYGFIVARPTGDVINDLVESNEMACCYACLMGRYFCYNTGNFPSNGWDWRKRIFDTSPLGKNRHKFKTDYEKLQDHKQEILDKGIETK